MVPEITFCPLSRCDYSAVFLTLQTEAMVKCELTNGHVLNSSTDLSQKLREGKLSSNSCKVSSVYKHQYRRSAYFVLYYVEELNFFTQNALLYYIINQKEHSY